MIVEYIRYTIPAERSDAFEAAYARARTSLDASPECLSYELSRCTEDVSSYVLRIEWESIAAHLEGFRKGWRGEREGGASMMDDDCGRLGRAD